MAKKKIINWLDNISLFSLYIMIFLVPFSSHFVRRFFFIGFGCLVVKKILEFKFKIKPVFIKNYLNRPVLIFVLTMLFVTLLSKNFYESQKVFVERILFYGGIFLLVKEVINTKKKMYFILRAVGVSAFVVGIDAVWQYFTGFDLFFGYPKNDPYVGKAIALSGPFGSYNFFSGYLEAILPFIIFLTLSRKNKYLSIFLYITLGMLIFSWLYVFERATLFSVAVSVIIVSFMVSRKYAVISIVCLIIIGFLLPVPVYQRILGTFAKNGDSGRFLMWQEGINAFNEAPLIGQGLGGYSMWPPIRWRGILHAHNTYLELLVDTGLIGLFSFLYLLFVFLRQSFISLLKIADKRKKLIFGGLIASCISYFLAGLFCTNMIVGVGISGMFWVLISLAAVLPNISFDV